VHGVPVVPVPFITTHTEQYTSLTHGVQIRILWSTNSVLIKKEYYFFFKLTFLFVLIVVQIVLFLSKCDKEPFVNLFF
jgi:hypothetical protein